MANISLKGEDIILEGGKSYIVIDTLYLTDIRGKSQILDKSNIEQEVREKVFPFPNTETPFASLSIPESLEKALKFGVNKIKKGEEGENISKSFSSDTGLIAFIEKSLLLDFASALDYNQLVDSLQGPIDINYWAQIEKKFGSSNCALILAPGINKGFDFDGSGFYKIEI